MKGALIEYGEDFLGPIPNVVIFQFNPESMSRNVEIPSMPHDRHSASEMNQVGSLPSEVISFTAHFDASDLLDGNDFLAKKFGIGPQLSALEKMVRPQGKLGGAIGEAINAIGSALSGGGGGNDSTRTIPREEYPKILFAWGLTRILPVTIESISITEQQYDSSLNPIRAEVAISLRVIQIADCTTDRIAKGASEYSSLAKDAQAIANLGASTSEVANIIPF